jgi:galactokinase
MAGSQQRHGWLDCCAMNHRELLEKFQSEFGAVPKIFSAPGRVNLIGEHTDYNEGFVLPCAIGFYVRAAVSPRSDGKLSLRSSAFQETFEFDLDKLPERKLGAWCDYVLAVAHQLKNSGVILKGANLSVHGEVPLGAGLSSSAALEVASALALRHVSGSELRMELLPRLCQSGENEFAGAHVGIMDPFVSCFGKKGHAVLLDCRSLSNELVPVPQNVNFVICNTKVKHELAGGEYNRRRKECEEAVAWLTKFYPDIRSLRDVAPEQVSDVEEQMPTVLYKRAHHVVTENTRVLKTAEAFRDGDVKKVDVLMRESHASLRDDYEVSCRELDVMVEAAEGLPGHLGGRMTGGGFGGCTVNLVESEKAEEFSEQIVKRYKRATGIDPDVFACSAADGAVAELNRLKGLPNDD